jgi:Membrane domain of glycerophosphoryl diester phosphodiesterase
MTHIAIDRHSELRVGAVLKCAWTIFSSSFFQFFIVTLIGELPQVLLSKSFGSSATAIALRTIVDILVGTFLGTLVLAVIVCGALQTIRGRSFDLREALGRGIARFWPLLALGSLLALGLTLGLLFLIVPGFVLSVRWAVAAPVCVVEGYDATTSMRRSAELTYGFRWKIFGIALLVLISGLLVVGAISFFNGFLIGQLLGPKGLIGDIAVQVSSLVLITALVAFYNSVIVVIYHDLRVTKEGVDIDQIAAVFD